MIEKTCKVSGEKFLIEKEDLEFYAKMGVITQENLSDSLSGKISDCVGLPTLCPEERQRKRSSWRNDLNFYARVCDLSGEKIVSNHSLGKKFPVYKSRYWWGDKWDAMDYEMEFDFSKPFFEQFKNLYDSVPQISIMNDNELQSVNCGYCQDFALGKNCYMVTNSWHTEDAMYSSHTNQIKDICDCSGLYSGSELVYESVNSMNVYDCLFLQDSQNCSDCLFGLDLIGCKNCIGCVGLRNKEHYVFNKKYSVSEYDAFKKTLETNKFSKLEFLRTAWSNHLLKFPRKFSVQKNCENSTGHELFNSKNIQNSFGVFKSEDSKYIADTEGSKNSYDSQGGDFEWNLEGQTCDNSYMSRFTAWCWKSKDMWYSDNCHSCQDCFGCVGLKHKKYCILNKQYSKEEYFELKEKIIDHMKKTGEWGEFFPASMSPFAYNETVANEYFPLTKTEAEKKGYKWKDENEKKYVPQTYKIPDDINDVPDSIVKEVLACEQTGKNFKIQKAELKFYRKMNLPIPRLHPDVRHANRMALRNPRKLWSRQCDECECELQTTFDPARPEKILCEDCYLKVVD